MTPDEALRKLLIAYERRIAALEEWRDRMGNSIPSRPPEPNAPMIEAYEPPKRGPGRPRKEPA